MIKYDIIKAIDRVALDSELREIFDIRKEGSNNVTLSVFKKVCDEEVYILLFSTSH